MKKEKQESPAKAAKKIAIKSIQLRLIKTLKTITTELGQEAIDIEKEAKKLAKKIAKHLKTGKEEEKTDTPVIEAKKPSKGSAVSKAKPVSTPAKKAPAKATPVKAAASKKISPKTAVSKNTKK